jgi:hypothetical protein
METIRKLFDQKKWPDLAKQADEILSQDLQRPGERDPWHQFIADHLLNEQRAGDFWRLAMARCKSREALGSYLCTCFRRMAFRSQNGYPRTVWHLRSRTQRVLHDHDGSMFQRHTRGGPPVYGLFAWPETPERGEYVADHWSTDPGFPTWTREFTGFAGPGLPAPHVEEGCRRLLDFCGLYCRAFRLGQGLAESGWFVLLAHPEEAGPLEPEVVQAPDTAACPPDLLADWLSVLRRVVRGMKEQQRYYLVEYQLPKWCGQQVTLEEVAEKRGHTVANAHRHAKSARGSFKVRLAREGVEAVDWAELCSVLHFLFENRRLGDLLISEENQDT